MMAMSRREILCAGAGLGAAMMWSVDAMARPVRPAKPLLLAHRGASALRPEHTLASYAKAIADGADFIEPDLCCTKDGALVARHENNIAETTDVAAHPEFADRRRVKVVDGEKLDGWFTEDFALAELKTLRAKERLTGTREESHSYDGQFQVVTLEEVIDFVAAESAARGKLIGLIPEVKHSTYFASIGLPIEARMMAILRAHTYTRKAPVVIQSFEIGNLQALRKGLSDMPNVQLMQLIGAPQEVPADRAAAGDKRPWAQWLTPEGLAEMATYADWISPNQRLLIPTLPDGRLGQPSGLAEAARKAGLLVGCWTFRPENRFLPVDLRNGAGDGARNEAGSLAEMARYLALGLDGFFTDDPALGRAAIDRMKLS
ncbi:glycerophosphodiester phosphodiesterase [Novosphingobium umbonatum]|uniref:glycerophosphodiester phosphodiesterase n=1 Tax=Novosphingobium umbonatum TaxID=1908524 RepID=A0A3S2VUR3_9SPHN|nr:glycerophosphodiester phosphodiesterase [Novosphingobium umbonatum]RVU06312.1 glycerophosphodiester phosphodiesterase [Novosphingobium umbonatum]